jgi:hypothetical protein
MVALNTVANGGGTEFEIGVVCKPRRGLVYWFDGAETHRGLANNGNRARVFAAFVLVHSTTWNKIDWNVDAPLDDVAQD